MNVSSYFLIVQQNERKENPRGNPLGRGDSQEGRDRRRSRSDLHLCAVPRRHIKIEKRLKAFFFHINPNERFGFPSLHGGFRKPFDEFVNLILRLTFEMPERPENYRNAVQTAFRKVGYRLRSRGLEYVE